MHVKHENKIPPTISKDTSDDHKTYTVKKEKKQTIISFSAVTAKNPFYTKMDVPYVQHIWICCVFKFAYISQGVNISQGESFADIVCVGSQ